MQRPNVSGILKYRILELEAVVEQDLSPVRLVRVGEDPTFVILGLDLLAVPAISVVVATSASLIAAGARRRPT